MNAREMYRTGRRLIRDNGNYAFRWMKGIQRDNFERLHDIGNQKDYLQERADILVYCKRENVACTVRHTTWL